MYDPDRYIITKDKNGNKIIIKIPKPPPPMIMEEPDLKGMGKFTLFLLSLAVVIPFVIAGVCCCFGIHIR